MDLMVGPIFASSDTRAADHFIVFLAFAPDQITVGKDGLFLQTLTDILRIDEIHESLSESFINVFFTIILERLIVAEVLALDVLVFILRIGAVTDGLVMIEVDVIDAAVIGSHGGDH